MIYGNQVFHRNRLQLVSTINRSINQKPQRLIIGKLIGLSFFWMIASVWMQILNKLVDNTFTRNRCIVLWICFSFVYWFQLISSCECVTAITHLISINFVSNFTPLSATFDWFSFTSLFVFLLSSRSYRQLKHILIIHELVCQQQSQHRHHTYESQVTTTTFMISTFRRHIRLFGFPYRSKSGFEHYLNFRTFWLPIFLDE